MVTPSTKAAKVGKKLFDKSLKTALALLEPLQENNY